LCGAIGGAVNTIAAPYEGETEWQVGEKDKRYDWFWTTRQTVRGNPGVD
jgi:hypothetical protein